MQEFLRDLLSLEDKIKDCEKGKEDKKSLIKILSCTSCTVAGLIGAGLLTKYLYLGGYNALPEIFSTNMFPSIPAIDTIMDIYFASVIVASHIVTSGSLIGGGYALGDYFTQNI